MANQQGDFLWYELITTDPDAASAFYGEILGWSTKRSIQPDMDYREFQVSQTSIGGMMAMPADSGDMRPGWLGYIAVDDVDATLVRVTAAGGTVHMPATDIPEVGRIAMVGDPQGAVFYVMTGIAGMVSMAFSTTAVGIATGMNSPRPIKLRHWLSTASNSAGPPVRVWTWGLWASTSSSRNRVSLSGR